MLCCEIKGRLNRSYKVRALFSACDSLLYIHLFYLQMFLFTPFALLQFTSSLNNAMCGYVVTQTLLQVQHVFVQYNNYYISIKSMFTLVVKW